MPISNNKPRDHHCIPVFYLKQWAGANRKVIEYNRKHGNFLKKPVGPKATGFQTKLYAFPELPADMAQHIEDVFLRYADSAASDALKRHLSGGQNWTGELRSAWSRFIVSLLTRHPDVMADLRVATMKSWERAGPHSQRRHEETKEAHDPATFDEYIAAGILSSQ